MLKNKGRNTSEVRGLLKPQKTAIVCGLTAPGTVPSPLLTCQITFASKKTGV